MTAVEIDVPTDYRGPSVYVILGFATPGVPLRETKEFGLPPDQARVLAAKLLAATGEHRSAYADRALEVAPEPEE